MSGDGCGLMDEVKGAPKNQVDFLEIWRIERLGISEFGVAEFGANSENKIESLGPCAKHRTGGGRTTLRACSWRAYKRPRLTLVRAADDKAGPSTKIETSVGPRSLVYVRCPANPYTLRLI